MKEIQPKDSIDASIRMPGSKSITHRALITAGLAIVAAGVVLLLYFLFGRSPGDKPRRGLTAGLITAAGLLIAWLVLTVWLSISHPQVLSPPPDPHRIDTLHIIRTDTIIETKLDTVEILDTVRVGDEDGGRLFFDRGGR